MGKGTKSKDKLRITGEFTCQIFEHGILVKEYSDKNLVIQLGRDYVAKLLAGISLSPIGKISFGTNGSAVDLGNTTITSEFLKSINSAIHQGAGTGETWFSWQLDPSEANGKTIVEFGLKANDGSLFARKVGLTINKSPIVSATGIWKIKVTSS